MFSLFPLVFMMMKETSLHLDGVWGKKDSCAPLSQLASKFPNALNPAFSPGQMRAFCKE